MKTPNHASTEISAKKTMAQLIRDGADFDDAGNLIVAGAAETQVFDENEKLNEAAEALRERELPLVMQA